MSESKLGLKVFVRSMYGKNGNPIPNQFIIEIGSTTIFQSYHSRIAIKCEMGAITGRTIKTVITLDETKWNFSRTTKKYLAKFLGVTVKEIKEKIESGEYKLCQLNE